MSGWLILWVSMFVVGLFVFLVAAFSTQTDETELTAAVVGTLGFLAGLMGALGWVAWLIVRTFG